MTLPAPDGGRPLSSAGGLLFVYGTLRRGFSHHHILERLRARQVGQGSVRAELYDLGAFPGARPATLHAGAPAPVRLQPERSEQAWPIPRVVGELYQLQNPRRDLKVLDGYEGFRPSAPAQSFFRRELMEVVLRDRSARQAWVYWLNRTPMPVRLIAGGDYALR